MGEWYTLKERLSLASLVTVHQECIAGCFLSVIWILAITGSAGCSPETFSSDITSTSPSEWHVFSNTVTGEPGKTVPIPSFTLASNDCYHNDGLWLHGWKVHRQWMQVQWWQVWTSLQVWSTLPSYSNQLLNMILASQQTLELFLTILTFL